MPDSCAAADCKPSPEQRNVAFFRFPLDPERCKQWVGSCGRADLQGKSPEYLHRNFKLCSRHFEASLIHKESDLKTALKDGAVPTIFDFTTKKGNAQNSTRKRKIQATAAEPVEAKKLKDEAEAESVTPDASEDSTENAVQEEHAPVKPEKEDPATSKAKELLKIHFKETLAFTGFSIANNVSAGATKSMGGGAAGPLAVDPVCAEKIDPKDVLRLGEDVMREEIRNASRMARFFSILLQDKTNIEGQDQIPVFIRSVSVDGFPQKHLLGFLPCDVDSDSLYHALLSEIRNKWGLRMEHCRGFTYLTTGSLCKKLKEFSCRMLRDFPQVVLAPSAPYAFNMWLIRSLPVLSVQDVVDTVEEVASVLRQSETLMKKLLTKITAAYSHIKGEVDRVKESCQNNWEFGTDAFQTMLDILEPLLNSIGEMCTSALSEVDASVVEQLLKLKEKLKNFNFIITLVILKNTLCCVSILNPSLRGIISISSTLQYTISNALKLLNKHLQEIPIFHRKWFSDAVGRAKKLGVPVTLPADTATNGDSDDKTPTSPEDYYRETLSKMVLQYLIDEVKRVLGVEMVRILRWLSLVPSYMADHNFSIRKDKVADANLNNLARPDSFYDELGCWEVKWRHASKRRILPTGVFATLKIPDIGFYPNVQSLLRVLGSIPCVNADSDVYVQYDMVLERYRSYMKATPPEKRLCNMAFVYVNQDVHFNIDDMVQSYVESHPDILQLLCKDDEMEVQPSATENNTNDASKDDAEEPREVILDMELERPKPAECSGTDKEALKSALKAALDAACNSQSRQFQGGSESEVEYVTKSEMNEVLKVCADVVRDGVLSEAGNSFFSLFIDRSVRFGETDLLPLFLRFVDSFDIMRLELMGFVEAELDTEAMCERLFDIVTKEWRLDLKYCRGQAYLGSGENAYKLKAFACKVQEKYPLAICTHCSCYSFNTWWSRLVPVPSVSRALDILEKMVLFFSSSPELEKQLDQVIAVGLRESYEKIHEFQGNFCSSWEEKHDSYDVFSQILEPLVDCLERFQNSTPPMWSLAVINQAKKLLQLLRDFDFIVAIVALKNISSFTRELSAALQKDHFSAASQLCQISGIVSTLNRLKTNVKVFHQNWFDEACSVAQALGVQVKVPESVPCPRDNLLKPAAYYKDAISAPLVDHIINSVKDHFSDDHKEALNFLSLVPCSVTMSYTFESLKSKAPLYVGDLPDPDNFFTELSCWKVKWKTKVVSPTIPDSIFQTLRLPLMQYFANINTLLKIMSVLPSTALEHCGEVKRYKMFQDYLRSTYAKDRTPCLAVLQVATNFNRDLDRMVMQCMKVTPKTLEGICLDKEAKTLRNSEPKVDDNHNDEEMEIQQDRAAKKLPDFNELKAEDNRITVFNKVETPVVAPAVIAEGAEVKPVDENGHSDPPVENLHRVFMLAGKLARKKGPFSDLPVEEQEVVVRELGTCRWGEESAACLSQADVLESVVKSVRHSILSEIQESPFFSIIIDKAVCVDDKDYAPVFIRFVDSFTPKVELLGFLPLDTSSDTDSQAKTLSSVLCEEWGLQMACCRGQSFMCTGSAGQGLRELSLGFLESFPLAVNTPSEACGLAYWLAVSLHNDPIAKVLGVVEDLLLFLDQSPRLHVELCQTREGLLDTPGEALAEVPETCLSKWKKAEDFFDILVDMLDGVLSCLDSVSNNADGSWSNSMSIHALMLSTAIRESDFVISLVILKNACAPVRNCSTVFRCGNPADIICELEKIPLVIDSMGKMLENVAAVHGAWFEEATRLAAKVAGSLSYPDSVGSYDSPEVGYRETVSIPVLMGLIEEMKLNFSECHLKALRVLSLLPTCNPLPVLPDAADKLYTIYQSDLPEADAAEDEITAWAAVWREKYQDCALPTSISETLHHPESRGHPNVTTLLRLVAVLPSISMECDLMKTTLNSLRSLIGDEYGGANKIDAVMLLMHRTMLRTLEQVIDRCMELDVQSHGVLAPVKESLSILKPYSDLPEVPADEGVNTSTPGVPEILNGTDLITAQDQAMTAPYCEDGEVSTSAPDCPAAPPYDAMEINPSNGQAETQEPPGPSAHPTEIRSPHQEPDVPAVTQGVCAELRNGNVELVSEAEAVGEPKEPHTNFTPEDVLTESGAVDKTTEPITAVQDGTMEVSAAAQDATTTPESPAPRVTEDVVTSSQDVLPDPESMDVSTEHEEPEEADQTPSTVSTTPSSTDVPTVSTTPSSTDVPTVSTTPSSTDVPTVSTTPSSTDVPTVSTTPSSTDVPTVSTTPSSTDVPTVSTMPSPTDVPTESTTPSSTDVPTESTTPSSTDVPAVSTMPSSTDVSAVSTTPSSTDVSAVSTTPSSTDVPAVSTTPSSTDVSAVSTTPSSTDVSAESTTPLSTDVPAVSTTPSSTDVPVESTTHSTSVLAVSTMPSTDVPVESTTPSSTSVPAVSTTPSTSVPAVSTTPSSSVPVESTTPSSSVPVESTTPSTSVPAVFTTPSTSVPAVSTKASSTSVPAVSTTASSTSSPAVSTTVSSTSSPAVSTTALSTSGPAVSTTPSSTDFPAVSTTPSSTEVPAVSTTPSSTDVPAVSTTPSSTDVPAVSTTPSSTDVPAVSTTPSSTDVPAVSTTPSSTDVPAVSTTPSSTDVPAVSTTPSSTDVPAVSTTPSSTDVPAVSTTPSSTDVPAVSTTPSSTESTTPLSTVVPAVSIAPSSTDVPTKSMMEAEGTTERKDEAAEQSLLNVSDGGIKEDVADAEGVVQGLTSPASHNTSEIATELPAAGEDLQEIGSEPERTVSQDVTSKPETSAQSLSGGAGEDPAQPSAPAQSQAPAPETSPMEPQKPEGVTHEEDTDMEASVKPVSGPQDTSMETDTDHGATSMIVEEAQDVSNATMAAARRVTADPEPSTTMEQAAEDVAMDTTEAEEGLTSQPTSSVPPDTTSQNLPMEIDAASERTSADREEGVQDDVMESQDESQSPSAEVQDIPMQDLKAGESGETETAAPAQNGTCESGSLAPDAEAVTPPKQDAPSDPHDSAAAESKEASAQGEPYATDPSKAAGEDLADPHKGVLSFYSSPAQEAFFGEMQSAKFFSIICEQQIEIEGHTYIPVGICYLENHKTPCEDVLAYVPLDQDAAVFVDSLTAALSEKWGLNLASCRGQSLMTVGAAGAQVRAAGSMISQRYPRAVRTFSSSMSLNTWLAKSCIISEIADSFTWVERMLQWVTEDEEKRAVLYKTVASLFQSDAAKHSDLTDRLSRNQWERSHDTLDLTIEILEAVMLSLNDIKENHDVQAERTQAGDFMIILQNFEFILTLVIVKNVLSPTKSLSQNLQGQPLDVYRAVNSVPAVLGSLSDMKSNIDAHLQTWYQEAVVFASKLQVSVDHTSQECLIIYCRDIISKGAIEHSVCEIAELFSDAALVAVRCTQLVPYVISETDGCCADPDPFQLYLEDLPDPSSLQAELRKWRQKWLEVDASQQLLHAGLLDTLNATDAAAFPNIDALLRLLVVLPCFRKEDSVRQGKKSLVEFNQQRSLLELYPL